MIDMILSGYANAGSAKDVCEIVKRIVPSEYNVRYQLSNTKKRESPSWIVICVSPARHDQQQHLFRVVEHAERLAIARVLKSSIVDSDESHYWLANQQYHDIDVTIDKLQRSYAFLLRVQGKT